jgi:mono/diheme cytochrome c family protein
MRWIAALLLLLLVPTGIALAQDAEAGPDGDVARGEDIYQASCAMCHGTGGTGMMGMHPALTGVVDRLTIEGVEVTIRNGRATRPPMPAFDNRLDDTDIADLIAYLDGLPDGPRNFAHDNGQTSNGAGTGPMMDATGSADGRLWVAVTVLTAALAGVIGYLIASRRHPGG